MKDKLTLADDARELARVARKEAVVEHDGVVYHLRRPKAMQMAEVWDILSNKSLPPWTRNAKLSLKAIDLCVDKMVVNGKEIVGIPEEDADDIVAQTFGGDHPVMTESLLMCGVNLALAKKKGDGEEEVGDTPRPT